MFDRETVTIPAGHVRRSETAHRFVAKDDVLGDFVESGADVDIAVGEWRTVVQDVGRFVGVLFLDRFVERNFVPLSDPFRFARNEICPHREIGLGEIESFFQVFNHATQISELQRVALQLKRRK